MIDHRKAARDLGIEPEAVMIVGGERRAASGGGWIETSDPTTGETLCRLPAAAADDIDAAVAAARAAFEGPWGGLAPGRRQRALEAFADAVRAEQDTLARLEALDAGVPLAVGRRFNARAAHKGLRYYAGWIERSYGEVVPVADGKALDYAVREPYGVVAIVIPFNTPGLFLGSKAAAALAAGNTVVIKPSEHASLAVLRWAALAQAAGLPPGTVNVVTGGPEAGAALCAHPGVDKVSFTGGSATGARVMQAAARAGGKPVTLELGGKSPHLVFADADLPRANMAAVLGAFALTGQACAAGSRLLVERPVHDAMLESVAGGARNLPVGDPLDDATLLGPLIHRGQLDRVRSYLDQGRAAGARLLCGGDRPEGVPEGGCFIRPAVFADVPAHAPVWREEIFGPVLCARPFADEREAIALANDTAFGLAAGVWTRDLARAHRVARALRAGVVWVNAYGQLPQAAPFGGMKGSGFGREGGRDGFLEYTQVKNVYVDLG